MQCEMVESETILLICHLDRSMKMRVVQSAYSVLSVHVIVDLWIVSLLTIQMRKQALSCYLHV